MLTVLDFSVRLSVRGQKKSSINPPEYNCPFNGG